MYCFLVLSVIGLAAAQVQQRPPLYSTYTFNPLQHLTAISPYFEPEDPPRAPSPPQGCSVTRAAYLVRHAAINANDFDYETYIEPFTKKLSNSTVDWSRIPQLSFLSTWIPPSISEEEQLTRTGKLEAAQLGVSVSYRYPSFRLPERVWTSTAERTVKTAEGFVRGLEMDEDTINVVQVFEGKQSGANSLTPYSSCPAYSGSTGSDEEEVWDNKWTGPITARFNSTAPGFNWTSDDIIGMQELCGYETVIRGSSPFCSTALFSPDEWLQFEYGQDLHYHYNIGYGNPVSGAIGFPWVNATMDLLSAPTAAQDLYVSFTHRELPPAVFVALGLFNNSQFSGNNDVNATMPQDQINYARVWQSSKILPFLTNLQIERMNCTGTYGYSNQSDPTYYRMLVNQSPQTLPGCYDGPGESCSAAGLQTFLQQRADLFDDFSQACGVKYGNSTDQVTFYTNSNNGTMVGKRHA